MRNDFLEARERQEIHWRDEEEVVLYREFSYCTASADHLHEVDVYDVSAGTVGKCTHCGRAFREMSIAHVESAPPGIVH